MIRLGNLMCAAAITLFFTACVPTPAEVNESGHEAYMRGDYPGAFDVYEDAMEQATGIGEPRYNAGNALYRMDQFDESIGFYDESLKRTRGEVRSRGLFNRGNAAYMLGSYAEAAEAYRDVLRINPDDLDAKHNLELTLRQMPPPDDEPPPPEEDESSPPPPSESPPPPPQAQQTEPMTGEQAQQVLEAVGQDAQTLQQGREQSLVSSNPQTEFDW